MTGGFWGADADQLRALAKDFDQKASQLSNLTSTLTASINGTAAWSGPDATTFRQDWNTRYRASLAGVNQTLLTAATALVKNADEQEQASAADQAGGPGGSGPGGSDNGPGGSDNGGDSPGSDGPGQDDTLLDNILDNPMVSGLNDYLDSAGIVGGLDNLLSLRQLGSFSSLDAALDFRAFAGGFNAASDFMQGNNWGSLTQGLSNLLGDGAAASRVGSAAEFLGSAGKVLGPAGAVLGYAGVAQSLQEGDAVRAGYDFVGTTLGVIAPFTPPPVSLALGAISGGMALGGMLYDNVPVFHDAVDNTVEAIGDAGEAIADGAHDFADGVAEAAKKVWPF